MSSLSSLFVVEYQIDGRTLNDILEKDSHLYVISIFS